VALSPMMSHYLETKKQYSDCILFYRLGDFYEMFFEDALTSSRELELTLTGRDCGLEERAPMCGVPFHAADTYINRLVSKGYKVAIAEQVEDPKLAKGLVKREVIKVVTPGTNINAMALDEDKNNYLMCIYYAADFYSIALADITTGEFLTTQLENEKELMDEVNKFPVAEIISNHAFSMAPIDFVHIKDKLEISLFTLDDAAFAIDKCERIIKEHFNVIDLSGLGLNDNAGCIPSVGGLLGYLYETQKAGLEFLNKLTIYSAKRFMVIDSATRRNLELTETMREKNKKGSLLWVLDKTKTAMGARRLRNFIERPLIDSKEIIRRQDAIAQLNSRLMDRDELREYLNPVYDLERLLARISYRTANPRDLIAFKSSLEMLPHIKTIIKTFDGEELNEIADNLDCLEDLYSLIHEAIVDDPPINVKEGGIVRDGYLERIDKLRQSKTQGKNWLVDIEEREREETGIKSLKVRYNKVFGYYIEVTNTFKDKVPDRYVRKQTLVNAERYITEELKELEETILGAEDKLFSLEYDVFNEIREKVAAQVVRIQKSAAAISKIDAFCSLAYVAEQNRYVRPHINLSGIIDVKDGRHPVVEKTIAEGLFIPNDTYSDEYENRVSIITGPNMAGKSTYMRQLALIVLMASIGSYVPASYANVCVCDRIFTRVGASDDLASGRSTFMVEMTEVAGILRNATSKSLIILDEIGRGTSTFDGLSIAWAVVEYIADREKCGAKTFFSTHYHELTELEGKIDGVKNYCISVKEQGHNIIFLRKIIRGGADKSYGIQVASLAGVPAEITNRAFELVTMLVDADSSRKDMRKIIANSPSAEDCTPASEDADSLSDKLTVTEAEAGILRKLREIDLNNTTLIDAMNILYDLKKEL
jgi:DNA mismatch repair protein MutS